MNNTEFKASMQQVITFLEVENILEQIRNNTSTNAKTEILMNNKHNDLLAKVLEYTYNPHKKYGISANLIPTSIEPEVPETLDVFEMLDKLAKNNINNDLRMEFGKFIAFYQVIDKLLIGMVTKDLKLGCNVNTINKVWKDLIPTSETGITIKPMLASKFDFDKAPKGEFAVTEKLDGIRCIAICIDDSIELYTRQGKLIEGCIEIETQLRKLRQKYDCEFVLDGEILANDCDYETVYKETTKRVKNKNSIKTGIHFMAFDVMDIKEFRQLKCETPYYKRLETLLDLGKYIEDDAIIKTITPLYIGRDIKWILELLEEYRTKGAEGLMVNLMDSVYEFKRSKDILKVKVMQTADLRIIGFEEGQGRNEGKLGALLVEYKDCVVGVGSGFSDYERELIWKNQSMYLGKICEIQFFEETKNKEGGVSLRFPVWKHLRLDKDEPSYN